MAVDGLGGGENVL